MCVGVGAHDRDDYAPSPGRNDALDMLAGATRIKIRLARLAVAGAARDRRKMHNLDHLLSTLALWSEVEDLGPVGMPIVSTRSGAGGACATGEPDLTRIPRYLAKHHASLVSFSGEFQLNACSLLPADLFVHLFVHPPTG